MIEKYKYHAVLSIAGSDSGGGAGIQADLKTFSALGCFGTSAITAVTVQNTMGVKAVHHIPPVIVAQQISTVVDDIQPQAIKIGLIPTEEVAIAVAAVLKLYPHIPIIFDPVMVSSSGYKLMDDDTIVAIKTALFPLAALVTPNIDEAMLIACIPITGVEDMKQAAIEIIEQGCNAVLIKGGHLQGNQLCDVYLDKNGICRLFESVAIESNNTHGTGCTLSSAIAAFVALGHDMRTAIEKAKAYVHEAIEHGKDVKTGEGHGPLNHFFNPQKMIKYSR
ncbi:bifunctional hydroxymethylpyrimidine kinase/phosphomethylpyrimidine kinase [Mucilaginibacter sp. SP1R1]|uniref:bifunctional hydroxymethylpyrimidine kinase/phosphomethylpyrimidine kinase n=1 Tax=Mucilaginibacter sp. SP1R1 TaxID=2723091 RepID=UPI001617B051|nr:bifunctional hydroxymethylpyrimidine kinase/phosphomethylpyrimidine kinase [Mucilaginibacter sp. SP1R1]MBB6149916.1 hydroxymethylpyrimidine/phosphomethylpyrimidine kinase [Mucilaginibacter sp. SP1R1]